MILQETDENQKEEIKTELEVAQITENVERVIETSRRGSINEISEVHQEIIIEENIKDK